MVSRVRRKATMNTSNEITLSKFKYNAMRCAEMYGYVPVHII